MDFRQSSELEANDESLLWYVRGIDLPVGDKN
jgi:hypothetical protein